jgi:hypothetical protein
MVRLERFDETLYVERMVVRLERFDETLYVPQKT